MIPSSLPHLLYKNIQWADEYGAGGWTRHPADEGDAEVVSSEIGNGMHAPVLDLDVPHGVVPSSTTGHSHLFIDVPMTWRQYRRLLRALARAGILEKNYVKASIRRHHTAVRVPWLRKGTAHAR